MNYTFGSEGLFYSVLVFVEYPIIPINLATTAPLHKLQKRSKIAEMGRKEMSSQMAAVRIM